VKAMVLAAGLGTRLRPLTDSRPKALVEVAGRTLLEMTLSRLRQFGVQEVIINVHHFAGMVAEYLKANNNFGLRIELSREDDLLLDTGGGLKKAAWFFLEHSAKEEPFILHNVDIVSNIDLSRMLEFHNQHHPLATVAVQHRETSRYLLFNEDLDLCGRRIGGSRDELARASSLAHALAFAGIHVISPRLFRLMQEEGVFSIIDCYLRLAREGERILAFRADEYYWRDLGRPDDLRKAAEDLKARAVLQ
jgi:NDP-sugar pyrophosphorylase family protein